MSEIDKRVVELELDNSNFNRNVKTTKSRIDELKQSLDFKDVSDSIDKVQVKFSALDVAVTAIIANIATRAANCGIQLVKSLSIDNISSGWSKFEQKTKSVATIMSQTIRLAGKEINDYSAKMEAVNSQLDKLNWFTDQTSYNFTDMVENIGKFTAAGQDLDVSVNAMMGIANWAALSGQNAETASRAMYQLAQAMSKGNVQLIDYKSIQNANMDTQEFRQTVLDTAVAMGELTKQGDSYLTKNGKKFIRNNFTESLSDKWFTSDVLTASLSKYSSAVQRIYEIAEETGLTAAQVMARYSDQFDEFGLKAFKAAQEARTFTDTINAIKDAVSTGWLNTAEKIFGGYDESKVLWTDLADSLYEVFAAGGDVRNQILGIWGTLSGRSDLFAHDPNNPDKQGAFWNIYDAIVSLVDVFKNSFRQIFSLSEFKSTGEYVNDVANKFKIFTKNLQESTKRFKNFIENNKFLENSLKSIFGSIKIGLALIKSAIYVIDPLISIVKNFTQNILNNLTNKLSNLSWIENILSSITDKARSMHDAFENFLDSLLSSETFGNIIAGIKGVFESLKEMHILQKAGNLFKQFFDSFVQNGGTASNFNKIVSGIGYTIKLLMNVMKSAIKFLSNTIAPSLQIVFGKVFRLMGAVLGKIVELLAAFFDQLKNFTSAKDNSFIDGLTSFISSLKIDTAAVSAAETFASVLSSLREVFYNMLLILKYMLPILNAMTKLISIIVKDVSIIVTKLITRLSKNSGIKLVIIGLLALMTTLLALFIVIAKTVQRANGVLRSIQYAFNSLSRAFAATAFEKIAAAILIMAGAFYLLGKMDLKSIAKASLSFLVLTTALVGMYLLVMVINDYTTKFDYKQFNKSITQLLKISFSFIELSLAMLILSKAMAVIATIDKDKINSVYASMAMSFALLSGIMIIMSKLKISGVKQAVKIAASTMLISLSVTNIVNVMKKLSNIDWNVILMGSLKIVTILSSLIIIFKFISKMLSSTKGIFGKMIGLSILSSLLSYISSTFSKMITTLQSIKWQDLLLGIVKLAAVITTILAVFKAIEVVNINNKAIFKVIILSIAISMLSDSLKKSASSLEYISTIPFGNIAKALLNLTSVLIILYALTNIKIKSSKIIGVAISLDFLSVAISSMAVSLHMISQIPLLSTFKALISIISVLGLVFLITEMKFANPLKLFAISMSIIFLGQALQIYATGLKILANVPFSSLFKGILALVSGLTILAIAAKIMSPGIAIILKVSFAVLVLGGALLIVAYALNSLSASFNVNVESMWETLTQFLYGFLDFIQVNAPKIVEVVVAVILSLLKAIDDILPQLTKTVINLIKALLKVVKDTTPDLLETVAYLISEVLKMLKANIKKWTKDLVDILVQLIEALTEKLPELITALGAFLEAFIINTLQDIAKRFGPILNALITFVLSLIHDLGVTFKKRAKDFAHTFVEFGINLMEGLKIGIVEGLATIIEKIPMIGKTVADGFRSIFGIHSPSTVMMEMGKYLDEGLAKGVSDNANSTTNSMVDSMSKILGAVNDTLDSEIDDSIVISPILDTSNIKYGVKDVNNIMSGLSGSVSSVSGKFMYAASNEINRSNQNRDIQNGGIINNNTNADTYNVTFNVETNNPEELAKQTDIILQRMKLKSNLAKGGY